MKGLIIFALIGGVLVFAGYGFLGSMLAADPGQLIAFACGKPNGERQEIQIVVPIAFPKREPPRISENNVELWREWIAEHWIIEDSNGERILLKRKHAASLIPTHKVGTPDCYLIGYVKTGMDYTFDFIPSLAEGKVYRRAFKVTEDGVPFRRENFTLLEDA